KACVNRVITDLGVLDITDHGLHLVECAPGVSTTEIINSTDAELTIRT
ncbi:succinyl-CoA--3-ketoacid-CoA transferase, partial [Streptomyces sp. NPDC001978]